MQMNAWVRFLILRGWISEVFWIRNFYYVTTWNGLNAIGENTLIQRLIGWGLLTAYFLVRSLNSSFELVRHSDAFTANGEVFKQNMAFKGWVKIVTKYSDADECLFCGDTVLELQYDLADCSTKWLNKDRYPSLWGIFVSVFGQCFGLSIGEAFE